MPRPCTIIQLALLTQSPLTGRYYKTDVACETVVWRGLAVKDSEGPTHKLLGSWDSCFDAFRLLGVIPMHGLAWSFVHRAPRAIILERPLFLAPLLKQAGYLKAPWLTLTCRQMGKENSWADKSTSLINMSFLPSLRCSIPPLSLQVLALLLPMGFNGWTKAAKNKLRIQLEWSVN